MKDDMRRRMRAYAGALNMQRIVKASEDRASFRGADDPANAVSTTGTIRDQMENLKDGEMLVIPIGGDADDFQ